MSRFILIHETTRHACYAETDEIRALVDIRQNPGGYTDVDLCMAMIASPDDKVFRAFPLRDCYGQALTIHSEGRMDYKTARSKFSLKWKAPGHRCTPKCLCEPLIRS